MPGTATASKSSTQAKGGSGASQSSAIRTVGPMIPLAIALVHGALTARPPSAPAGVPLAPVIQLSETLMAPIAPCGAGTADSPPCTVPYPMLAKGHPVDWWFVFKLNVAKFPECGGGSVACPFGGSPQGYNPGLQYAFASSENATLAPGGGDCLGDGSNDPVGATFDQVYNGGFHYVIWNDQFYGDPKSASCGGEGCDSPWGHSKGMIAWNDQGEGMVMQVSTPSWPASGSAKSPRLTDGNTLGCLKDDDVKVSQHFFALRLSHEDLDTVLDGLANASVVTDPKNPQIVSNGGPEDVQEKVEAMGVKSRSTALVKGVLSSGIELISKPSGLHVPPWQMVSSVLGGVPLRTATWWASPTIPATTGGIPACWDSSLTTPPGAVDIAATGTWKGTAFGLEGGIEANANHAKLGVSTSTTEHYAIFGDMNQQGTLSGPNCASSQNGRGGMFFVMDNAQLSSSLGDLLAGTSPPAPAQ